MKTKLIPFVILSMIISFTVSAQTSDAEAEAMANLLGVQKKRSCFKTGHSEREGLSYVLEIV